MGNISAPTSTTAPLAAETEAVNGALDNPDFCAGAFARSIIVQIAAMTFVPERIIAMRLELRAFEALVRKYGNDDAIALRQEALRLLMRARELAQPVPVPRPAETVRAIFASLQDAGWASATIWLLEDDLRPEDLPLKGYDKDGVTTATRRIDKKELIIRHRPHGMTAEHYADWDKQHCRAGLHQA